MKITITKDPITKKEIELEKENISNDIENSNNAIKKILLKLSVLSFFILVIILFIFNTAIVPGIVLIFLCSICISVFTTSLEYRSDRIVEKVKNSRNRVILSTNEKINLLIPVAVFTLLIGSILGMPLIPILLTFIFSSGITLLVWNFLYGAYLDDLQHSYSNTQDCSIQDLEGIKGCMKSSDVKLYCSKVGEQKRELIRIELEVIKDFYDKQSTEKNDNNIKQSIYGQI